MKPLKIARWVVTCPWCNCTYSLWAGVGSKPHGFACDCSDEEHVLWAIKAQHEVDLLVRRALGRAAPLSGGGER